MNQTVNVQALREWLEIQKKVDADARANLARAVRVSPSLLDKVLCGRVPGRQTCFMLSHVTGIAESELFPVSNKKTA